MGNTWNVSENRKQISLSERKLGHTDTDDGAMPKFIEFSEAYFESSAKPCNLVLPSAN